MSCLLNYTMNVVRKTSYQIDKINVYKTNVGPINVCGKVEIGIMLCEFHVTYSYNFRLSSNLTSPLVFNHR